jgi:phage-related tail fiber protein
MPANTFKGNNTGSTADPKDLTAAQAAALLPVFQWNTKGLVPGPASGSGYNVLCDDGYWKDPTVTFGTNVIGNVGSTQDWDTFTNRGQYTTSYTNNATAQHAPAMANTYPGTLEVVRGDSVQVAQKWTAHPTDGYIPAALPLVFFRAYTYVDGPSGWTGWQQLGALDPASHNAAAHSTIPLNALAVPTGNVSFGGYYVRNVSSPNNDTDAANKGYVDAVPLTLSWKAAVRCASTANIASLSGAQTIDGVSAVSGNRVLVKDQTTQTQNGIYVVANGAWTRATDMATSSTATNATVFVSEGTAQADTEWTCTSNAPAAVGSYALVWAKRGGGAPVTTSVSASISPLPSGAGDFCYLTTASAVTITLGTAANTSIVVGSEYHYMRDTTQTVTFAAGSGATIVSADGKLAIRAQNGVVTAKLISSTRWVVFGDLG